jgi:predicted metal-dependent peptidase
MDIKEEFEEIRILLTIKWPFMANLLRRSKIIASQEVATAGVTLEKEIKVNPEFLTILDLKQKIFVYLHELWHLILCHPWRQQDRDPQTFNEAADCVVNTILDIPEFREINFPFEIVSAKTIAPQLSRKEKDLKNLSAEQIFELLEKNPLSRRPNIMRDLLASKGDQKEKRQDQAEDREDQKKRQERAKRMKKERELVIQEGDPELSKAKNRKEIEDYWKGALAQNMVEAKMAGQLPAGLERLLERILKPKIDWKSIIKKEILNGLGRMVISDWRKRSRKFPGVLPGIRSIKKPTVWFLVDTSGSISQRELQRFFSEIYGILRNQGKGIILPWDVEVYPQIKIERASDLLRKVREEKIFGGGGTRIRKALEITLGEMERGDLIVVLTDGYIYDIGQKETQEILRKLSQLSTKSIFATLNLEVPLPLGWQKVKIEV